MLDEITRKLADKYFCNLSVFQSMPDVWGIDQMFPIMPLHRLDEEPLRRAILQDLTCDSDGHIEHYVDGEGVESSLPLHALRADEPYLLGIFLLGAYQEILGDMHNLFGDTDAVNVELTAGGGYRLVEPRHGDTVEELLRYVEFDPAQLLARYRDKIAAAGLDAEAQTAYQQFLASGLEGYTSRGTIAVTALLQCGIPAYRSGLAREGIVCASRHSRAYPKGTEPAPLTDSYSLS